MAWQIICKPLLFADIYSQYLKTINYIAPYIYQQELCNLEKIKHSHRGGTLDLLHQQAISTKRTLCAFQSSVVT